MKKITLLSACIFSFFSMQAKVTLPDIISDYMVLQQNSEVAVWGKALPKSKVTIKASWNDDHETTVSCDRQGNWKAYLKTPSAGGPYTLTFDDGEGAVGINDVLTGEVWLCTGQSNMVMPMKGFKGQPVEDAAGYIVKAKPSVPIRMCTIKRNPSNVELESCEGKWYNHTPVNVSKTSAVAYFFARQIQEYLDVPVGIIITAWGGSTIESWMSRDVLKKYSSELDLSILDNEVKPETPNRHPCYLYNGMLHPLADYGIKGTIWYQGCSNRNRHEQYKRLQPDFVKMLRELFGKEELPFYYVQIAPYSYDGADKINAALLREAQADGLNTIPNCGMVVSMDCGDDNCIHPARKKPIGDRLAYLALEDTYGLEGIDVKAPTYKSMEIKDGKAFITFNVGNMGIGPKGDKLDGFEIAGEDKVFHKAVAKINGKKSDTIVVASKKVSKPVAVRYGFRNVAPASVFNNFGIPAAPFRTDNWE